MKKEARKNMEKTHINIQRQKKNSRLQRRMRRSDPWERQQMVLQKQREGSFKKVGNTNRKTSWGKVK